MFTVRHATDEDREAVFRLASQLSPRFEVLHEVFIPSFAQLIRKEDVCLPVAEAAGTIIAYLLGWTQLAFYSNGPVGWVQEIVVDPVHRRAGVGKQLVSYFEAWAAKRGSGLVSLATRGATHFYLALGYQESATYYRKMTQLT